MEPLISVDDLKRADEISLHMTPAPHGFGKIIDNRPAWERIVTQDLLNKVVNKAEACISEPLPPMTDEAFLHFSRTGNRTLCDELNAKRCYRIETLTIAECFQNEGTYLEHIEEVIQSICGQKTWVLTSHDENLDNFHGRDITIDLMSSALAWRLAAADFLLQDKLSEETRTLIRSNIERRVFEPFEEMLRGERKPYPWLLIKTNNWNACCLAGVTGAALTLIGSPGRRAFYVMAFEKFIVNYLKGFSEDGYCSEGLNYWNYGFGHFIAGVEIIRTATNGFLDIFAWNSVREPALFGIRSAITGNIYPAIGDCAYEIEPDERCMAYTSLRFGLGLSRWEEIDLADVVHGRLYEFLMSAFPEKQNGGADIGRREEQNEMRTWFDRAGLYIGRQGEGKSAGLNVVIKGGHNHEHHNHNDVGGFIVVSQGVQLISDIGLEVYTGKTFGPRRYESQVLSSYGHSVPKIAGKQQLPSDFTRDEEPEKISIKSELKQIQFKDDGDVLILDLKGLYDVGHLQTLTRSFFYSRDENGSLHMADDFAFSRPDTFESAIMTFGTWRIESENRIVIAHENKSLRIDIDASGEAIAISSSEIEGDLKGLSMKANRIAVKFTNPLLRGRLSFRITGC